VLACDDCHTPRKPDNSFDFDRRLGGVDCFADADPADDDFGCLSSRNLTNHETGLKNRSDREIKDMFLKGVRPADSGGQPSALHPFMPYWTLANMRDADADAIVAYLRTLRPVDHRTKPRQAPFEVDAPAPAFPKDKIPEPRPSYADRAAALRGKYLAADTGACLECHTPRDAMGRVEVDRAFQGGHSFGRAELGLPPIFPERIYTANLTPHESGLKGWTVADVVKVLQQGTDKKGSTLCPPMPVGPMGAYAELTHDDAEDLAHYLLSLEPVENEVVDCAVVPPDLDAGADLERDE
jgi:mono/diheme cytochrome c family protein